MQYSTIYGIFQVTFTPEMYRYYFTVA
jgi:hypothetical protein